MLLNTRYALLSFATFLACFEGIHADSPNQRAQNAERARSILSEGINSKDPDTRVQTILAAGMVGKRDQLLAPLERSLQDKDVPVRIATVNALADLKLPGSEPDLEKTLKTDEVPEVAFAAAKALYAMGVPAGKAALMDVYDKKVNANSNVLKKKSRSVTRSFYSFKSATMFVVGQGIGYVPVPGVGEGLSAMNELLGDPDLSARAAVLLLLGREKTPAALDLLKRGLTDDDWSVRASAAQVIAYTGRSELEESLVPLFNDKKDKVRFRAAGAYLHLYLKKDKETTASGK